MNKFTFCSFSPKLPCNKKVGVRNKMSKKSSVIMLGNTPIRNRPRKLTRNLNKNVPWKMKNIYNSRMFQAYIWFRGCKIWAETSFISAPPPPLKKHFTLLGKILSPCMTTTNHNTPISPISRRSGRCAHIQPYLPNHPRSERLHRLVSPRVEMAGNESISHLGKRKIIDWKAPLKGDMLVLRRLETLKRVRSGH